MDSSLSGCRLVLRVDDLLKNGLDGLPAHVLTAGRLGSTREETSQWNDAS